MRSGTPHFLEPNPFYPKLGTEYTLVKNTSCY